MQTNAYNDNNQVRNPIDDTAAAIKKAATDIKQGAEKKAEQWGANPGNPNNPND